MKTHSYNHIVTSVVAVLSLLVFTVTQNVFAFDVEMNLASAQFALQRVGGFGGFEHGCGGPSPQTIPADAIHRLGYTVSSCQGENCIITVPCIDGTWEYHVQHFSGIFVFLHILESPNALPPGGTACNGSVFGCYIYFNPQGGDGTQSCNPHNACTVINIVFACPNTPISNIPFNCPA